MVEKDEFEDNGGDDIKQNKIHKNEDLSLDSSIWGECDLFESIDLNVSYVNEGEASNEFINPTGADDNALALTQIDLMTNEGNPSHFPDFSHLFETDNVFLSKHALVDWAQAKGRSINTIVVTRLSDSGTSKRRARLVLGCERGGVFRDRRPKKGRRKRDSSTKKCDCPFAIRGVNLGCRQWKLKVLCGSHNHDLPKNLVGHPYAGRLSQQEKKFVGEMTVAGVKPRDILCGLKERNKENKSTLRTIYNAKANMRTHALEGRTAIQQLMKILVDKHYVYWYRCEEGSEEILDLFWAEPKCILLAKRFPSVVIVDCTYKTNKYKMPLFAMVGITSTNKTFSIAHCFLYKELEDNYTWALQRLKLLFNESELPSIFITDKEFASINAIRQVFPEAHRMLCTFHISKSVEQHCKKLFRSGSVWEIFIRDWNHCVTAKSEEEFNKQWEEMKTTWAPEFPNQFEYLANNWFAHRDKFVHAWTNQIKHRGNRTTNRAEGSHGKLKKFLESGEGTFDTVFAGMANMLRLQLTEVEATFERSLGSVRQRHHGMPFKELRGTISLFALDLIKMEKEKSFNIGLDTSACDHLLRTVYGLPCAHELLQYGRENCPIPLGAVDEHWRKLTILENVQDENDLFKTAEMMILKKLYDQSTEDEKKVILRKLKDLGAPYMASLKEPRPVKGKGRPRGSKSNLNQKNKSFSKSTKRDPSGFEYAMTGEEREKKAREMADKCSQVSKKRIKVEMTMETEVPKRGSPLETYKKFAPIIMHPFIADIEDVRGDGHCGFRCVAKHMGWHDDDQDWKVVRCDLIADLDKYKDLYEKVWGSWYYVENRAKIDYFEPQANDPQFWMLMPDAGFLIASAYSSVVVLLSPNQNLTFFPHASPPPKESEVRIICLMLVHNCHFVKVTLKDNSPLPFVARTWYVLQSGEATAWEELFAERLQFYRDRYMIVPRTKDSTIIIK